MITATIVDDEPYRCKALVKCTDIKCHIEKRFESKFLPVLPITCHINCLAFFVNGSMKSANSPFICSSAHY